MNTTKIKQLITKKPTLPQILITSGIFLLCVLFGHSLLSGIILGSLFYFTYNIQLQIQKPKHLCILLIVGALLVFLFSQLFSFHFNAFTAFTSFHLFPLLFSILLCLFLVCTVFFVTLHPQISITIPLVTASILGLVNDYVFTFRGTEFCIADILAVKTAMNVAGNYTISVDVFVLDLLLLLMMVVFVLFHGVHIHTSASRLRKRMVSLLVSICCGLSVFGSFNHLEHYHWELEGSRFNGFLLNFLLSGSDVLIRAPQGYEDYDFSTLENTQQTQTPDNLPNVIVIMDESFADFSVYTDKINTNTELLPFYHSLSENTIKGYAYASVFGGGTSNSEYEFLTGNTTAFLPSGSNAFQQYVKDDVYSIVDYFNRLNYRTIGMHPYLPNGWQRQSVWQKMGFQETYFLDDFPQKKILREYVSDQEMMEEVLRYLNETDQDQPLFLFGVTMQNHGWYDYKGDNFTNTVELNGYTKPYKDVEQYLSLANASDEALRYLIESLSKQEKETIVVFFGDHQPNIDSTFYTEIFGKKQETLDEREITYKVPYLIWANFTIIKTDLTDTSLNYLSTMMLEAAGMPLAAYQQYLSAFRKQVPIINTYGYQIAGQDHFKPIGNNPEINDYRILIYNNIFDTERKSKIFKRQ